MLGVDQQVEHHLLQLVRVREHVRQVGSQRRRHPDAGTLQVGFPQAHGFGDDLVDRDHQARGVALAGECEQLARDPRGALGFLVQGREACGERRAGALQAESLGQREDGAERVVQFVRDPGHRLAQCRHLLGLQQLLIEVPRLLFASPALADIPNQEIDSRP